MRGLVQCGRHGTSNVSCGLGQPHATATILLKTRVDALKSMRFDVPILEGGDKRANARGRAQI